MSKYSEDDLEPRELTALNSELSACMQLVDHLSSLGVVDSDVLHRMTRRFDALGAYANRRIVADDGTSRWVIEGSAFVAGMPSFLATLPRVDFSSRQALRVWIRDFDRRLAEGARMDAEGGELDSSRADSDGSFVRDQLRRASRELEDSLAILRAIEGVESVAARVEEEVATASEAASEAVQYAENSRAASGITGSNKLAANFWSYAEAEAKSADLWRFVTVSILLIIAAYAVFHLANPAGLAPEEVLSRIAISVPFFALAGYCGREAGQHRSIARWARSLAVQLQTIDAYCDPLAPEDRSDLRLHLGKRVFGTNSPPVHGKPADKNVEAESASKPEIGASDLQELLDMVRSLSSSATAR